MATATIETFIIFKQSSGIGHLVRCSAIAEAFRAISHVTMFYGGKPVEGYATPAGVDFVQLPGVRWDLADTVPVAVDPGLTLVEAERIRSELIVDHYRRIKPAIVIVEHFPFSPKFFGTTLDAMFAAIDEDANRPAVICSLRAYPRSPRLEAIDADSAGTINRQLRGNFSCALHHADPALFPLASLGPYMQAALSGISVRQTGFVRRPFVPIGPGGPQRGLLLTVGGGSAFGAGLLRRWIKAARAGSPDLFPIHAVCGPLMDADDRKILHAEEDADIFVHDRVANLDELISSSRAVVCMGGYNTLVEALSLGKPVLAFPHSLMGDQAFQVEALAAQGMVLKDDQSLPDHEITALMNRLLRFRPRQAIDCDGGKRSVELVRQLLDGR